MEALKKKRSALRSSFTRAFNTFDTAAVPEAQIAEMTVLFRILEERILELKECQKQYMDLFIVEADEAAIQKEFDDAEYYQNRFIEAQVKYQENTPIRNPPQTVITTQPPRDTKKARDKYPKIELVKFDGQPRAWLRFWSQFKKIDADDGVDKEDKFQYLIQCMTPGSRADVLVQSYPPTSENYDKAIESLKKRFGRDDLQIEIYVRELLQLVLQNALKPTKEVQLASLYDKFETYMNALSSLGVTTDKCAAMLFPLVESSLPEETLRAWQRSRPQKNDATEESKDRLSQLIDFIASEVDNELRISIAREGFTDSEIRSSNSREGGAGKKDSARTNKSNEEARSVNVASARDLLISKPREKQCIFCESKDHEGADCSRAKSMTIAERQDAVKKKRACFNCLKYGHSYKNCRVNVRCSKCSRRHVDIMCFDGEKVPHHPTSSINVQQERNLANINASPQVFMQTLRVKMHNKHKVIIVRAIIDSGSQRSYITKAAAERINYLPIAEIKMNHLLFGGKKSEVVTHNKYKIHLSDLSGGCVYNFDVLDTETICESIPAITKGEWLKELADLNIKVSGINGDEETVDVLIGVDVCEKLMTGTRHILESGLVASETCLGWTLTGKVPGEKHDENLAITAISMFAHSEKVEDLWALDVLGIKDPIECKTKLEREQEAEESFLETVVVNSEGRYEVQLLWIENHADLNDNKEMAIQRLQSTIKRVTTLNLREQYEEVFNEWLADGVIERVPAEEEEQWGHYLPHRPVIKENSTTKIRPVFDASAKDGPFPALNECLQKGSNLIELLASNLLRFREGNIGVISDIRRAFLQISIAPKERDNFYG